MKEWLPLAFLSVLTIPACKQDDDAPDGDEGPTASAAPSGADAGPSQPAVNGKTYKWSFDDMAVGAPAQGFSSPLGTWSVAADPAAPSAPNVFRQSGRFGDPDFPRAFVPALEFSDLTVRVKCRPESGGIDQACGLVFRLRDADNYYITRANALEGNVRLYHVIEGSRVQFAGANANVTSAQWHTLEATVRGDSFTVSWDGAPLFTASDRTFASGRVGVWTKADSVTAFDELEVGGE